MQITSKQIGETGLRLIVEAVSESEYAGNVRVESISQTSRNSYRLKLGTLNSYAAGSRTSASGRHGKYLCWHGFRDVIAVIMLADPKARVATGMRVYRGAKSFLDQFPETAYQNIGSMMFPQYLGTSCVDCADKHLNGVFDIRLSELVEV